MVELLGIKQFLNKGHKRSVKARVNILKMLFLKGASIIISLILVPLTIDYVDIENYGVWLTISTVVVWISFFDIGLNNGLKNKLTEAKAKNNIDLAQRYVSTTYFIMFCIFFFLMICLVTISYFVDWNVLLKLHKTIKDLPLIMIILIIHFCVKFILSTINIIYIADQKPANASLILFAEQLVSLIIIYILTIFTKGSLLFLCIAFCFSPIVVLSLISLFAFKGNLRDIRPLLSKVDLTLSKSLFSLGFKFFIIQIAAIIQFQTSNFIIIRSFGGVEVTNFNIAYKYFGILSMIMVILISPLWSAVTDAAVNADYNWIKNAVRKYLYLTIGIFILGVIMFVYSDYAIKLWLGSNKIDISTNLFLWMFLNVLLVVFSSIFVNVLNGFGELNIQFVCSLISPIVFIGLSYIFINILHLGVEAVLISSILANFNGILVAPIQYVKLITRMQKNTI